ncbi:hypothetical protein QAD02_022387 [Eretmocerus hayati]|uniref:Uncharacterized protein n=1 Tax=Eretmocerus hayati TaxID=131215 RepID=A0ACC2PUG3_9HYME|nr:hypothetical protein QAD02_022387 [Eretmocerus hayati]
MKIQRLKKVQKNLGFFVNNFKFRQPYQVLIDGTFSHAALENKFNIQDQMAKYFQAEVKLLTTQCVIMETEKLGPKLYGAMLIVKQYAVHKCGHEKNPVSGSKCLRSMVGKDNSSRYIVATQDRLLQDQLRKVPGVPIMYLHGKAPTLEPPSQISKQFAECLRNKSVLTNTQEETLKCLKLQSGLEVESGMIRKKKKKKGGPNPLSCKKKQNTTVSDNSTATINKVNQSGKIRKRKRVKLSSHIKEALKTGVM